MMATGVPPHFIVAVATEKIQETLMHETHEIRGDIAEVPGKMCDRLLQQFEVNGALPMTFANVQAMLTRTMQEQLVNQLRDGTGIKEHAAPAVAPPRRAAQWLTWYDPGRGKFCKVPPHFNFPQNLTMKPCWDLYLHGNNLARKRPYRLLDNDDMRTHADKCRLSNMKTTCKFIIQHTNNLDVLGANGSAVNILDSNPEETDILFAGAWPLLVAKLTHNTSRREKIRGDLVMTTVYNLIRKYQRGTRQGSVKCV